MNITTIKTRLVHANECTLETLLTESLTDVPEHSIIVISSKIIALCQNRVVDKNTITKSELIKQEADFYTPDGFNKYGHNFTIIHNTFIASAGIDESNVDDSFVLWPANPQAVANEIRSFLCQLFNRQFIGVIITDSSGMPSMRAGTIGIMIAHSGFMAVKKLAGTNDLFGRPFKVSKSAIGGGLAAAANVVMGESTEQTPIALISDAPFVVFQDSNPSTNDLETTYISPETDLYAPFIQSAPWQKGGGKYRETVE
ncbi:MAG: putative F420-0--gamma-glutamyl ligase [Candidatus Saccharibacteria bacterium]|nr:putative F420-0--gamma-glutamyl ligase [Candidatus Saccharibacteria bacterium]